MESPKWINNIDLKNKELPVIIKRIYPEILDQWNIIDDIVGVNQLKTLNAFREFRVAEEDFSESTGYGYDDIGREKFEKIYARIFGAESALVRPHFVSGTHTLTVAFFGLLRPGDRLLSLTGPPYDTLQQVIGIKSKSDELERGTLKDWGILYDELPLSSEGLPDLSKIEEKLTAKVKVAFIQRSLGYNNIRSALTVSQIADISAKVKKISPETIIMVDNCYGEFTETEEPLSAGADIIAGSLIKNPGGGLAISGGYVAGKKDLVEKISSRLTAPFLGGHLGAIGSKTYSFMGLFNAPTLTGNSLKSAVFAARLFTELGFETKPRFNEIRGDIVQSLTLDKPEHVIDFCRIIQNNSPVGSHIKPEPSPLPGYSAPVIMAAGTFIQGASGELSADAPMREPYNVFLQGAFTLHHALTAIIKAADRISKY